MQQQQQQQQPDIDAVSMRPMPNSTGRALLAEAKGARVRITKCVHHAFQYAFLKSTAL
jgi:hypothetical protein